MKLKDEVLWKVFLGSPNDPADTDIGETKLVPGGIDRDDAGNFEVPEKLWLSKWSNKCARRSVDCMASRVRESQAIKGGERTMDRDRMTCLFLVFVEKVGHFFDGLIMTSVGTAKNDIYTDGVFVDKLHGFLGVQPVFALGADRDEAALYFKVASEFLEGNLGIGTHDDVGARLMNGFTGGLATLLPDAFHGKTPELDGLGRASSGGADGLFSRRSMPKIGEDGDASSVDNL